MPEDPWDTNDPWSGFQRPTGPPTTYDPLFGPSTAQPSGSTGLLFGPPSNTNVTYTGNAWGSHRADPPTRQHMPEQTQRVGPDDELSDTQSEQDRQQRPHQPPTPPEPLHRRTRGQPMSEIQLMNALQGNRMAQTMRTERTERPIPGLMTHQVPISVAPSNSIRRTTEGSVQVPSSRATPPTGTSLIESHQPSS